MAKPAAASADRDMRKFIAYPNAWTEDENPIVAYKAYPKMPLVHHRDAKGELTGKADVPLYDTMKQPIIFENARAETEWLAEHPKEAALIAEAKMNAAEPLDKLEASNDALRVATDRLQDVKGELDQKDSELSDALAQLASAKAELAASGAAKQSGEPKIDKRTKEYREAHKTAEG
jgi:hypothetical protein